MEPCSQNKTESKVKNHKFAHRQCLNSRQLNRLNALLSQKRDNIEEYFSYQALTYLE